MRSKSPKSSKALEHAAVRAKATGAAHRASTETFDRIMACSPLNKPAKPSAPMERELLKERVMRAGYILRTERVTLGGTDPVVMTSAYTPEGHYIGDAKSARFLVVQRGIRPQLRTAMSQVCSIGYNPWERKWYGWSHRAIYGFKVGSKAKKGDCHAETLPVGFTAKTIADAKRMAEAFAESVS